MIDVLDLVTYLHREGKITSFRDRMVMTFR